MHFPEAAVKSIKEWCNDENDFLAHREKLGRIFSKIIEAWPNSLKAYEPSFAQMLMVDKYYRHALSSCKGRPSLVVLTESAAPTNPTILGLKVKKEYEHLLDGYQHFGHVNLVHSLTYGEDWMLDKESEKGDALKNKNKGTPTFWKLLSSLAGEQEGRCKPNFDHLQFNKGRSKKVNERRVQSRLAILKKLEERQIVLLDVSSVPVYLACGTKTVYNKNGKPYQTPEVQWPEKALHTLLRTMWFEYVSVLMKTNPPHSLLVLGDSLRKAIGEDAFNRFAASQGGKYCGNRTHPSARGLNNELDLYFMDVHKIAHHAIESVPADGTVPGTTKNKRNGTSYNLRSSKKRKLVDREDPETCLA